MDNRSIQMIIDQTLPTLSDEQKAKILEAISSAGFQGDPEDLKYIVLEDLLESGLSKTQGRRLLAAFEDHVGE